jgi:hypothetical protein
MAVETDFACWMAKGTQAERMPVIWAVNANMGFVFCCLAMVIRNTMHWKHNEQSITCAQRSSSLLLLSSRGQLTLNFSKWQAQVASPLPAAQASSEAEEPAAAEERQREETPEAAAERIQLVLRIGHLTPPPVLPCPGPPPVLYGAPASAGQCDMVCTVLTTQGKVPVLTPTPRANFLA